MRRTALLSILTMLVLACSLVDLTQLVPLPAVANTYTPISSPTFPLPPPPTYTFTPTLIGLRPTATASQTPFPTASFVARTATIRSTLIGPAISPTAMPGNTGFDSIMLSASRIYIGDCGKNEVVFTVQVTKPSKTENAFLFLRLRNKLTGEDTGWDRGTALDAEGEGKFTYTLKASRFDDQNNSWIVYQLVGTDDEQKIVARSPIFPESLSLIKCP